MRHRVFFLFVLLVGSMWLSTEASSLTSAEIRPESGGISKDSQGIDRLYSSLRTADQPLESQELTTIAEKTLISVTDAAPYFVKGCYHSSSCSYWFPHNYNGHDYISTWVGGTVSNPSQPDYYARFKPYLARAGQYEVYVSFYACVDTSTQVPFVVSYNGGSAPVQVNQYALSEEWRTFKLGSWPFVAGESTYVEVTDATGEPYDGTKGLTIGTVEFRRVNQPPVVSLSAERTSGSAPLTVLFTMSASDPDGWIGSWGLDINGDGNAEYLNTGNPPATQGHTYSTPGHYDVIFMALDNDGTESHQIVEINVTPPVTYSIAGRVTNESGNPISGVTISAGGGGSTTTDASGNYTLGSLAAGSYTLTPSKSGYTFTPSSRPVSVPPNQTGQNFVCDVVPPPTYSVAGRVTDGSGSPISGVTISAGGGGSATTDASGNYTLSSLSAGSYTLTPSKSGYPFTPTSRSVSVPPSQAGLDFVSAVSPSTYSIAGRVTDGSGNPISGVTISAGGGGSVTTDASGNYTLSSLSAGSYTLTPSKSGYAFTPTSRSVSVPPSQTGQDFMGVAPPSTYSITGRVTDGSGNPISGVAVSAGGGGSTTTDASGNYTLSSLSAGSYTLTPSKSGYTFTPTSRPVSVPPSQTGQDFMGVAPPSTYSVTGRVTDGSGNPISGVTISAGGGGSATTDAGGNYILSGLPVGGYTLTPNKSGCTFTPPSRSVTVPPSQTEQNFVCAVLPPPVYVYNTAFLTDSQLENDDSMTVDQIRAFLTEQGSYFRQTIQDVDGVMFDPSAVISQAATQYRVNPQVILTTLQKECSGVTLGTRPSDFTLSFLMGCVSQNTAREQLTCAAERFRAYHDQLTNTGSTVSGWQVGVPRGTQDGVTVTPATKAVAGQFTYTPYAGTQWGGTLPTVGGVYLFYNAWNQFGFNEPTPDSLSVTLSATPSSGEAPLQVDMSADVAGTASGTINYAFWWNCNDPTTSVAEACLRCGNLPEPAPGGCLGNESGWKCNAVNDDPKTVMHIYPSVGTYTAKVIVERGSAPPSESRAPVTVSGSPLYSISGRVVDVAGNGIEGVAIATGAAGSATTDANGYFVSAAITVGTYTVTPAKDNCFFAPSTRVCTVPPSGSGIDFVASPNVGPSGLDICKLQPGDILLVRSKRFAWFEKGGTYFTHAALYLGQVSALGGDQNDIRPRIAEAQGKTSGDRVNDVWETWLTDTPFWTGEGLLDWAVVRPSASQAIKDAAIFNARAKAAEDGVVFNIMASKTDNRQYYCSKLVWRSYRDVPNGPDLEKDHGSGSLQFDFYWVTPDDVLYSSPVVWNKTLGTGEKVGRFLTTLWSPAHITLVDPTGRRTGYDPVTGGVLDEIPGAAYSAPPEAEVETVSAEGAGEGWQIMVTGYDVGEYKLVSSYLEVDTLSDTHTGTTEPGQVDIYDVPAATPVATQMILLRTGWNLFSFHTAPIAGTLPITHVVEVLAPIAGAYDAVLGYEEGTKSYYPALPPELNDLQGLDVQHGYWIHMTAERLLTLEGRRQSVETALELAVGWNLVTYLPEETMAVAEALESIAGQYSAVLGYEGGAKSYYPALPPELNDLKCLQPGHGYWIHMTTAGVLVYPSAGECAENPQ